MADETIKYTELVVGAGHPSLTDNLNRLTLTEHTTGGSHRDENVYPSLVTTGAISGGAIEGDSLVTTGNISGANISGSAITGDSLVTTGAISGSSLVSNSSLMLTEQVTGSSPVATKGELWVKNTTPNELWFTDDVGNSFQLNTTQTGSVVQTLFEPDFSGQTATSMFMLGGSKPVNTDGTQFLSQVFTPLYNDSILFIEILFQYTVSNDTDYFTSAALFQDTIVDALASSIGYSTVVSAIFRLQLAFQHKMISGTTSPITFKVRVGNAGGAAIRKNANGVGGGTLGSYIKITETRP